MRVIDPTVEWTADAVGLVQRLCLRNYCVRQAYLDALRNSCGYF
jgi:hypothetical protein